MDKLMLLFFLFVMSGYIQFLLFLLMSLFWWTFIIAYVMQITFNCVYATAHLTESYVSSHLHLISKHKIVRLYCHRL